MFDPKISSPRVFTRRHERIDYLLVTDELTRNEVRAVWETLSRVVWVRQDGPLAGSFVVRKIIRRAGRLIS